VTDSGFLRRTPGTRIARACGPNDLWLPCLRIDPHDEERGSRGRPTPERSDLLLDVHANAYANSPYKIDPTGEIVAGTSIDAESNRQLWTCQGSHSMGRYEHRGYDCSSRPTLSTSKRQDGWLEMPKGHGPSRRRSLAGQANRSPSVRTTPQSRTHEREGRALSRSRRHPCRR
jgi:hypothetical protein